MEDSPDTDAEQRRIAKLENFLRPLEKQSKEELDRMVKMIPAGYVGSVEDAVSAVRFLLSDEARYINGANIPLSGAWGI